MNKVTKTQNYNRRYNKTQMKNLAIACSVAVDYMKANKDITAKQMHEEIGGVSKSQFAHALKIAEARGIFNRYYDKKARCFKYRLVNNKFRGIL